MTNQYVTITVTEDDKTLTITREVSHEWPGRSVPHVSELIDAVCAQARNEIEFAEREAAQKAREKVAQEAEPF